MYGIDMHAATGKDPTKSLSNLYKGACFNCKDKQNLCALRHLVSLLVYF